MTAPEASRETPVQGESWGVERPLDFAVVGASKSGTTSLFHYLRAHPRIYLPPGKDLPFFAADEAFARGWPAAVEEHYAAAPSDALWGTVTPRYMEHPRVPERLAGLMPEIRLVALLRNPIDRAFSQYRQQVRRGKEERTFAAAVADQLDPLRLAAAREKPQDIGATDRYLATGEYGRIVGEFRRHLPPNRLLVLFTEELRNDAGTSLDRVFEHLGLAPGFRPSNLERRYHVGGTRARFPGLLPRLRRLGPLRRLWRFLPRERRRAAWTWFFTRANVVAEEPPALDPEVRGRLVELFRPDVAALERSIGRAVPWEELR